MPSRHPYPHRPIRVVHVAGSEREIGRQHAEALRDEIDAGMLHFYSQFWKRFFAAREGDPALRRIAAGASDILVNQVLARMLHSRVPRFLRDRLAGMAEISRRPYRELATSTILPDLFPMLQAFAGRMVPDMLIAAGAPPQFGCSSFVAAGRRFLHGRNLDFPGVGYWDRYQVIQHTAPTNALRYLGFTTAGVPLGGITGINEAQISVSLHQHYCRETSVRGVLPFVISEEILSKARSLDDARAIIERWNVATSWAFVVTDGKTRDAMICETHPKARGWRTLQGEHNVMAHSNYFQAPACQPREYAASMHMNWDNRFRKTRLESLVRTAGETLSPGDGARFLSDHFDPFWGEEKVVNRTLSQTYNVQSLVLDPVEMKAWIAEGDCPVHLHAYREYDLGEIFAGRDGRQEKTLPGYEFRNERTRDAKEAYILSFVAALDGDAALALNELGVSLDLHFSPDVAYVSALMHLKQNQIHMAHSLLAKARATIESRAADLGTSLMPPEYGEILVYLARTHDLMGQRAEAQKVYRLAATHKDVTDATVKRIAQEGGPYNANHIRRIMLPYSSYIPFV